MRDIENSFPESPHLRTSTDRTLSSGTRLYATPSDLAKINSIRLPSTDTTLQYITPIKFDALVASAGGSGTPAIFTIRGHASDGQFEYYPSPNAGVTVHLEYQRTIVTVSVASAVPDIPAKYLELPILYAEGQGHKRRGRFEIAQIIEQKYNTLKQKMIQDLSSLIIPQDITTTTTASK